VSVSAIGRSSEGAVRPAQLAAETPAELTFPMKRAALFSLIMVLAVLSPVVQNFVPEGVDNFPLSYYPMFSYERPDTERLNYLVGDANGMRIAIPYTQAGSGGMNQVRRQINTRVSRGQSAQLCQSVSERIARSRSAYYTRIQTVQVMTGQFDLNEYFTVSKLPRAEQVRASCPVQRQR
jgi:hypothetical protein